MAAFFMAIQLGAYLYFVSVPFFFGEGIIMILGFGIHSGPHGCFENVHCYVFVRHAATCYRLAISWCTPIVSYLLTWSNQVVQL